MNAPTPVTLLLSSRRAAEALAAVIGEHPGFVAASPDNSPDGGAGGPARLVVYELGQDTAGDFERIARLLAGERTAEVFVTAAVKDPDCIIRAMRAGVTEFLPWPMEHADIHSALDRFAARQGGPRENRPREDKGARGRVIHVFGAKGGTGVTTVAVNAAVQTARQGGPRPTALLDARMPLGEAPLFLDFDYTYTWVEAARNLARVDATFLESLVTRHASGLDVLAAPDSLEDADAVTPEAASTVIRHLRRMYGTVFVDGSPYLDEVSLALMREADEILMVLVLSLPCLAGVRKILETFENLDGGLADKVRLVVSRHLSRSEITVAEAEDLLGRPVFWKIPNDYEATMAAINQGRPLDEAAPKSQAAKALAGLARELAPAAAAPGAEASAGLFGKLLGRREKAAKTAKTASFAIPADALGGNGSAS